MAFSQPAGDLRVARAERVEIAPERRQDQHVGIVQRAIHGNAGSAEGAHRTAVRADQAGFECRFEVKAELAAVAQASHMEKVLGLHERRGENPFGGQYADALDRGEMGHTILIIVGFQGKSAVRRLERPIFPGQSPVRTQRVALNGVGGAASNR